jgi:hypothetical protein
MAYYFDYCYYSLPEASAPEMPNRDFEIYFSLNRCQTKTFIRQKRRHWSGVGNGCNNDYRVASGLADTGNLPGHNGGELQGMALELRHPAQIDSGLSRFAAEKQTSESLFSLPA